MVTCLLVPLTPTEYSFIISSSTKLRSSLNPLYTKAQLGVSGQEKLHQSCHLKQDFYLPKEIFIYFIESPFRSQAHVLTFWQYRKNGYIRLISNFMTSQLDDVTACWPISHEVRGNQTMKFGQFIEYNKRNIFL